MLGQLGAAAQAPDHLRVVPRELARGDHRPHRERVVDLLGDHVLDVGDHPGLEPDGHLRLDLGEDRVDALVVGVLGSVVVGRDALLCAGLHDGEREIVVDVGVHAGERELDRSMRLAALLDQRPPRDRAWRARDDRLLGIEVQPREDDVEAIEKAGVGERRVGARLADRLSDLQVEPVEIGDAVLARAARRRSHASGRPHRRSCPLGRRRRRSWRRRRPFPLSPPPRP